MELRIHAEVDDLRHGARQTRPVLRRIGVGTRDVDALRPNSDANRIAGTYRAVHRDDDPLALRHTGNRESANDLVDGQVERVQRADEIGDKGGLRVLVHLARAADLLDAAAVHDRDAVGHGERFLLIVRHVDERRAELVLDPLQLELHLLAQLHVERAERLVEKESRRTVDERPR